MRERLRPYITQLMEQAHAHGTPVMRTLFYEFPDDPVCWDIADQYMFGSDALVAPILYLGQRSREVYLPAGSRWTNAKTGETLDGGQRVKVEAPLDTIPVFLRDSAKLPIFDGK